MDQPLKWFEEHKLVALIRSSSAEDAEEMIKAALAGGFHLFEISMQTPQVIRLLENYSKKEGCLFGAGAVIDGEMAQRAIKAGARFITSHYTDRDVISVAKNNDVFVIQGVLTPTEAVNAYQLGADLIKIYPADTAGGPAFAKSLRGALPFLKLAASGGVSMENAWEYLKYCTSVHLGKAIFDKALVRANNWAEISERARQFTQKLEAAKVSK
ncbi:MAG: bifunctional 4-hydroxy-2-oxoglutarate aldolase/2-dehydro-3-deoxy-phosphogluconate aldolase [Candidatus Omnitrophica bacterium]|nr:bifunctional 4-hydroxy-2-oxoglutarate aldolase/2-dehydro-3-deoxy-phosphogluconate aldolase [Candidatus Omnitrophota bacterium]